jgi:copper transport protein
MPARLQLWFSEQPDITYSAIRVVDVHNQEVSVGSIQLAPGNEQSLIIGLKPNLPDGTYTVIWKTASAVDGHLVKSAFSFVVGKPSQSTSLVPSVGLDVANGNDATNLSLASVWIRWLNYLAGALLVGCAGYGLLIWKRALVITQKQYELDPNRLKTVEQLGWSKLVFLSMLSLIGLSLGWLLGLIYELTVVTGRSWLDFDLYGSALADFALNSRYGQISLIRLGLLVMAALSLSFAWRAGPALHLRGWWAVLSIGAVILLTTSLNAHAAAQVDYTWLTVGVDWLHLLATAIWIGGVVCLALVLPAALRQFIPGTGERTRFLASLIPLFSQMSLICVTVLVLSGVYSSWIEIGSLQALYSTLYGQVLLAKLAIFIFIMALAAGNLLRISPKMVAYARSTGTIDKAGSMTAGRLQLQFKQAVAIEVVLLLAVLVSVGVLTSLEPANSPGQNSNSQALVATVGDLHLDLAVSPGQAGINNFAVKLTNAGGQPITDASLVQLRFDMLEMDMGQPTLELKATQPGLYTATGAILSMLGTWDIEILVQRPAQNDITATFQLVISNK